MMEGLTERVFVRVLHRSARACLLSYKWREMIDSAFRMLLLIRRAVTQCPPVSAAEARACVSRTTTQFVDNNRRSLVSMMRAETPTSQARPACVLAGMRHCCHHRGVWSEEEDEDDDELITKTTCPTWKKTENDEWLTRCRRIFWGRPRWSVVSGGCRSRCRWTAARWVVGRSPRRRRRREPPGHQPVVAAVVWPDSGASSWLSLSQTSVRWPPAPHSSRRSAASYIRTWVVRVLSSSLQGVCLMRRELRFLPPTASAREFWNVVPARTFKIR